MRNTVHRVVASAVERANQSLSGGGNVTTNYLTGISGMTSSTGLAAASAMRRAPHEGQKPLPLQRVDEAALQLREDSPREQ